ncbi:hypothetical protein MLD38_035933 [Melastoma candidum]|uniref:Uncharacterized protein n=1 Tax=Melastoma candidum TaxID=119954 RepID=A0ACB9LI25_9MYRT|nr:hypothetical protein MLD38_035933 [Melastoma candidum]
MRQLLSGFWTILQAADKVQGDNKKKLRTRDRAVRAFPAPEANAEVQANIDRRRMIYKVNPKSTSEKFPPPHQDGGVGIPVGVLQRLGPSTVMHDNSRTSTSFTCSNNSSEIWSGPLADNSADVLKRKKKKAVWGSGNGDRALGSSVFSVGTYKGKLGDHSHVKEIRSFA